MVRDREQRFWQDNSDYLEVGQFLRGSYLGVIMHFENPSLLTLNSLELWLCLVWFHSFHATSLGQKSFMWYPFSLGWTESQNPYLFASGHVGLYSLHRYATSQLPLPQHQYILQNSSWILTKHHQKVHHFLKYITKFLVIGVVINRHYNITCYLRSTFVKLDNMMIVIKRKLL